MYNFMCNVKDIDELFEFNNFMCNVKDIDELFEFKNKRPVASTTASEAHPNQ